MTSVGAIDNLVTMLRTQLAAGTVRARPETSRRPAGGNRTRERSLSRLIELRVKSIGADDPQRGRKAFRVFLEAVLLSEFGDRLINDPGFYQMVDDVQAALEAAPSTAPMVATAIEELLTQAG